MATELAKLQARVICLTAALSHARHVLERVGPFKCEIEGTHEYFDCKGCGVKKIIDGIKDRGIE